MPKRRQGDGLGEYRRKRDPGRTTEPFDPEPTRRAVGATRHGAFVCHLHDATRRHWDLRLEVGGTLKSFAVPRGPSLRTADKRLAVHTEDHPLSYLDFEDVIPEGSYGAGPMITWDRGRVRYLERPAEEGLAAGKLDFELFGYKLRGRWALVKTSGRREPSRKDEPEQWLLLKKRDAWSNEDRDIVADEPLSVLSGLTVEELRGAAVIAEGIEERAAALGAEVGAVEGPRVHPMLCASNGVGLRERGFLYELKLDGVRIVADKRGDEVTLSYRTGRAATFSYPEITRAVRALVPRRVVLDGEIVAFDDRGRPSFQRLARRIHATRPADVQRLVLDVPVVYAVFDLLAVGDRDLRGLPLTARKELLAAVVRGRGFARVLDHIADDGRPLWDFCEEMDLEGVVAKRADAPYREGPKRTPDWVKVKREREDDFVVVGWTRGEGGRGRLGALDVASFENGELVVRGKVGSGLTEALIGELVPRLADLAVDEAPAERGWIGAKRGRTFVQPELVVNVRYHSWTDDAHLRAPVFAGLRADIQPRDCTAAPPPTDEELIEEARGAGDATRSDTRVTGARGLTLTNQRKVFWPDEGYTKGDLCDYYELIAPFLLPYLEDRPVMLVRYPDGIRGKSFYQWRVPKGTPSWVRTFRVRSEEHHGGDVTTFIVEDVDTLLYIAQLGCIPVHVLAGRTASLEQADWLTIDFDVGKSELRHAVELARELSGLLSDIGLRGFPKTSGQTGLHVFVPLGPGISFEGARTLADLLGRILESRRPDIATMERIKDKRGARVYVDTGQTGRSRTIVAPWSVRAHPGATVSTPLLWDEVGLTLDPTRFNMFTVVDRAREIGDPMAPLLGERPDVPAAVEALGGLVGV